MISTESAFMGHPPLAILSAMLAKLAASGHVLCSETFVIIDENGQILPVGITRLLQIEPVARLKQIPGVMDLQIELNVIACMLGDGVYADAEIELICTLADSINSTFGLFTENYGDPTSQSVH